MRVYRTCFLGVGIIYRGGYFVPTCGFPGWEFQNWIAHDWLYPEIRTMTTLLNPFQISSHTLLAFRGAGRRNPSGRHCGPGISVVVMGLVGFSGCSSMMHSAGPESMFVNADNSELVNMGERRDGKAEREDSSLLAYVPSVLPPGFRLRECEDGSVIYEFDFVMEAERDTNAGAMRDAAFSDSGYPVFAMPEMEVFFGPPPPETLQAPEAPKFLEFPEFPDFLETPEALNMGISDSAGCSEEVIPGMGDVGLWNWSGTEGGGMFESGATQGEFRGTGEIPEPPIAGRGFELFMKTFAASCLFAVILIPSGCAYGAQRIAPCSRGSPRWG